MWGKKSTFEFRLEASLNCYEVFNSGTEDSIKICGADSELIHVPQNNGFQTVARASLAGHRSSLDVTHAGFS